MNPITIFLACATILLLASQLLCGFWLAAKGATPEGVAFHGKLGVSAAAASLATAVLALIQAL